MSICRSDSESREQRHYPRQTYNVPDECLDQHLTGCLPDDDPQDFDFAQVRGKLVIGYNPALGTQERLDPFLLDVWILGAEGLGESTGNHGKAWRVAL